MIIERKKYLDKLINKENNGLIKVITGIRRCGKSYLLKKIFITYLNDKGIKDENIIYISFDDRNNKNLRNPDNLLSYINNKIDNKSMYYLILDEIQMVDEFVDVLNSFLQMENVDIYVTGSNSKFLSSDIITEFRGRGDEIHVYPLTFKEYLPAHGGSKYEAWDDYFLYGGLPLILAFKNSEEKSEYLKKLFKETYLIDIIEKNNIQNDAELEELLNILSSSIGSFTNPNKLSKTFISEKKIKISDKTIKNYIGYFKEAFILNEVNRYDIKGKKYINTPHKYYFEDIGLRNARLNFRQLDNGHIMENIIYNELLVRGYNVDIGVVSVYKNDENGKTVLLNYEVDFIATLGSNKYYIQSAYNMDSNEKEIQEKNSLNNIDDSFKKIIVIKDDIKPRRDENGITTIGLYNFLLDENSLNL